MKIQIHYIDRKNTNDINYTKSKLSMAVHILAVSEGKIKDRLMDTFIELGILNKNDFPVELQGDFEWIKKSMTKNKAKTITIIRNGKIIESSTGRLGATVPYMRINKAKEIAERICYLNDRLFNEF